MQVDVKYHKVKFCECEQQETYKRVIQEQKNKIEQLTCTLHHLKEAVAKAEVCGVPLHHLSDDLAKHFDVKTHDFVAQIKSNGLDDFTKLARGFCMDKYPEDDTPEAMLIGWKAGVTDCINAAHLFSDQLLKISRGEA